MKEAFVTQGPAVEIKDVAIPEPGPDQIVTKVVVSGSNPKDWYVLILYENKVHINRLKWVFFMGPNDFFSSISFILVTLSSLNSPITAFATNGLQ